MELDTHNNAAQAMVLALVAAGTALWGWLGWLVLVWVCCMVLDYITGSMAAMRRGEWSSKVARDGVWHKVGQIIAVLVAALADSLLGMLLHHLPATLPIPYTVLLTPVVLAWYSLTELGSIAENAVALGAVVPAWLQGILKISADAVDHAGQQISGGDSLHQSLADLAAELQAGDASRRAPTEPPIMSLTTEEGGGPHE